MTKKKSTTTNLTYPAPATGTFPIIKTHYRKHGFDDKEWNDVASKTKPNDAYTVLQILQRHREGRPLGVGRNITYLGEDHPSGGIDPKRMELTDRMESAHAAAENVKKIKNQLTQQQKEKAKKEKEAALNPPAGNGSATPLPDGGSQP